MEMALAFVAVYSALCLPAFLAVYAAPSRKWLIVALAILLPLVLYGGLCETTTTCGPSLMVIAMPEPSDDWFVNALILLVGAALRTIQLIVGGRLAAGWGRLVVGVIALPLAVFFSFRIVHLIEALLGVAQCSGR
ncbi:hypothetical protein MSC49_31150 [Methylosinus sp. C49]|uniref:hypothetical protein n=1 Tax=Methylosinus sp. C49 TaxID=2699395 RepID=UPI00136696B9|nr:hypothetical protein [Methylosinus sp. C49]BBU63180.1 hypothetical protein MSC49_31150 [Methylosinus sp. C49]